MTEIRGLRHQAVHAKARPTHMASLPVAVNLQCHSARHAETIR
ncbi:MAG: fumarate hydratase [Chloroflexi bacterium]|nr:fumarate hydratase [Chloroflexota bacterium]